MTHFVCKPAQQHLFFHLRHIYEIQKIYGRVSCNRFATIRALPTDHWAECSSFLRLHAELGFGESKDIEHIAMLNH